MCVYNLPNCNKLKHEWRHLRTAPYLSVEIAVLIVGVVAVPLDVDALAEPGQAHDDEQLQEEDQLGQTKCISFFQKARMVHSCK